MMRRRSNFSSLSLLNTFFSLIFRFKEINALRYFFFRRCRRRRHLRLPFSFDFYFIFVVLRVVSRWVWSVAFFSEKCFNVSVERWSFPRRPNPELDLSTYNASIVDSIAKRERDLRWNLFLDDQHLKMIVIFLILYFRGSFWFTIFWSHMVQRNGSLNMSVSEIISLYLNIS